jgi:hypothetical protein
MSDDLLDRLKFADPAPRHRVDRELGELGDLPARIASEPVVVPFRRRANVRRAAVGIAAVIVALALIVPLAVLRPLGEEGPGGTTGPEPTGGGPGAANWMPVGPVDALLAAGVTYLPEATTFILADGNDLHAIYAVPPEFDGGSNQRVVFCRSAGVFQGPGGAGYEADGTPRQSSASPLSIVPTEVIEGELAISPLDRVVDRTGSRDSLPSGPPCRAVDGEPLEGQPGFGIAADVELPPIAVALPQRGMTLSSPVRIVGSADVFEATVSIRIRDATNNVIAESFATATCGTGCRGDFTADVDFEVGQAQQGVIEVYEASAKDGKPINVVEIPVTLLPPSDATSGDAFEGPWTAPDGRVVASDPGKGTEIAVVEGPDHCGWTSASFLHLGWPVGTVATVADQERQYLRDPQGLFADQLASPFDPDAELPNDAVDTGYHRGPIELWISPSDEDEAVYLLNLDTDVVERWTRSTVRIGCD